MKQEQFSQLYLFAEAIDGVIVSLEARLRDSAAELAQIRENWAAGLRHELALCERLFASAVA